MAARSEFDSSALLRRAILALAVLSAIATGIELAAERHWKAGTQLIPWVLLLVIVIAALAALDARTYGRLKLARALSMLVLLTSLFGVWEHIETNFDSGELDQRYSDSWETLPVATRWWLAISKSVGPSPPLAPAATAYAAICVLIATLRVETKRE